MLVLFGWVAVSMLHVRGWFEPGSGLVRAWFEPGSGLVQRWFCVDSRLVRGAWVAAASASLMCGNVFARDLRLTRGQRVVSSLLV